MKEIRTDLTIRELMEFMNKSIGSYLYCYGDLDSRYWDKTKWFAFSEDDEIRAIAMLYYGSETPVLIALQYYNLIYLVELLNEIVDFLPKTFYGHIAVDALPELQRYSMNNYHGKHYRMVLDKLELFSFNPNIKKLYDKHYEALQKLYTVSYPGNWFEKSMFDQGVYYGYFDKDELVAVAGTHIYSEEVAVTALGNITTHPDHRGRGFATILTSALCDEVKKKTSVIGLSVLAENIQAINCYQKVGFRIINDYDEGLIKIIT